MDCPGNERFVSYRARRLRFVECIPESIQSISFSEDGLQLALSRGDGNLELWANCGGLFQKKLRIPGKSNLSIETMTWCGNRLFTGNLSGTIEEWDFVRLQPFHSVNLSSGPIWCLKWDPSRMVIAAGCENGKVYLIQVSSNDRGVFQLLNTYGQENSRILCLTWSPNNQFLAIGTSNGLIKKIDVSSGSCELSISCEKIPSCIIWDLVYVNSAIVSADSLGRVQFWSAQHGTLLQSFKEHNLDVLSIAATPQGNIIFSTGVDQKIVCYKKIKETSEWIKNCQLKTHTHDVRAMDLSNTGLLATGGIDTNLNIVNIEDFNLSHVQKCSAFQDSAGYLTVDSQAHFVVQQTNTAVKVWSISEGGLFSPVNILDVKSNDTCYILSVAIAPNGSGIAVSTVNECFLYDIDKSGFVFKCLLQLDMPSYKMEFSGDSFGLLLATITKGVCLINTQRRDYKKVLSFDEICSSLPITALSVNKECSHFAMTGYKNETILYSIFNGTTVWKFPLVSSHIPLYSFTQCSKALIIYQSGSIMKYNISKNEVVELGAVKTSRVIPKGLYIMDDNIAALQYSEGLSLFRFKIPRESQNQMICSNHYKVSGILLSMSVCNDGTVIVIEQPSSKFIKTLPPVLYKENYGT